MTAAERAHHNDLGFAAFCRAGERADAGDHAGAADLFGEAADHFGRAAADLPATPDLDDEVDGPEDPWNGDPGYLRHLVTTVVEETVNGKAAALDPFNSASCSSLCAELREIESAR